MTWNETRINNPGKNRSICDILYITEPVIMAESAQDSGEPASDPHDNTSQQENAGTETVR